jgi:hypothetical protein
MSIKKIITLIIQYLNENLSVFFFKNSNLLSYNLFSKFYKLFICCHKNKKDYLNFSCAKLDRVISEDLEIINNELKAQENFSKVKITSFIVSEKIKVAIKKIVSQDLRDYLCDFEKYYNCRVALAWVGITRNYPIENKNKEAYSNFFHNDAYIFTLFKFFINLHDVSSAHGPMEIIKKDKHSKFIKLSKFKSRNNYLKNLDQVNDCIDANTGKKGEIFFCNTTELLHRASEPIIGFFRDMLYLNFVIIPHKLENSNFFYLEDIGYDIYSPDAHVPKIFAKPIGLRNLIKTFKEYKSSKIY